MESALQESTPMNSESKPTITPKSNRRSKEELASIFTEEEARVAYTLLHDSVTPTVGFDPFNSLLKKLLSRGGGIHCHYCTEKAIHRNHRGYNVCDTHFDKEEFDKWRHRTALK